MTRIHLLTPHTRPGDAVTNDLLGMRERLLAAGHEVHCFAEECHRDLRHLVQPVREYKAYLAIEEDLLIYHHSVGWPRGGWVYERTRNRRVVKHHNVTPPEFLRRYSRAFGRICRQGQHQTRWLAGEGADLWLADSEYNVEDLVGSGVPRRLCHAVAPFHTIEADDRLPSDDALAAKLRGRNNLLFVGRVAPNKGHLHLIRAFAHYSRDYDPDARLILVGTFQPALGEYVHELREEAQRLRLGERVRFTQKLSPQKLLTCYRHAAAFLCASEHEGFCVPLVEAMYHRVPVVAFGCTAVPYTLGDAGLCWSEPDPLVLAESIRTVVQDAAARDFLVESQWRRYQERFTPQAIGTRFDAVMAPLLQGEPLHA